MINEVKRLKNPKKNPKIMFYRTKTCFSIYFFYFIYFVLRLLFCCVLFCLFCFALFCFACFVLLCFVLLILFCCLLFCKKISNENKFSIYRNKFFLSKEKYLFRNNFFFRNTTLLFTVNSR